MNERLNEEQRRLVEEHLNVIDQVIRKCIGINHQICGMEYDDIYQVGAIGLCKAAVSYQQYQRATFTTYAFHVVRNTIFDYLRSLSVKQAAFRRLLLEAAGEMEQQQTREMLENDLYEKDVLQALGETKERYRGTARKGIEAIEMKMQGYSGKDIAAMYCVNANYITACISRARKYLQKDDAFRRRIA